MNVTPATDNSDRAEDPVPRLRLTPPRDPRRGHPKPSV